MSWFSNIQKSITDISDSIQSNFPPETATMAADVLGRIQEQTSSTGTAASEIFEKLTLQTAELTEERRQIEAEERRKEEVKNALAALLPWETRDEERAIFVDECKEAIMAATALEDTFMAPHGNYSKQPNNQANTEASAKDESNEASKSDSAPAGTPDSESAPDKKADQNQAEKKDPYELLNEAIKARQRADRDDHHPHGPAVAADDASTASAISATGSAGPSNTTSSAVPVLLMDFDLDAHVGLIKRVLNVDPNLNKMHAHLSGGAVKEIDFWKNYFHHCAMCRLKIGLDIHEIWGDIHLPTEGEILQTTAAAEEAAPSAKTRVGHVLEAAATSSSALVGNAISALTHHASALPPVEDETITFQNNGVVANKPASAAPEQAKGTAAALSDTGASQPMPPSSSTTQPTTNMDAAAAVKTFTNLPVSAPTTADSAKKEIVGGTATVSTQPSPPSDFELVEGPSDNDASGDIDLDDLDAEIARELES